MEYIKEERHTKMHIINNAKPGNHVWALTMCGWMIRKERSKITKRKMKFDLCKKCEKALERERNK